MSWTIDHIGIAVKDVEQSAAFYLSLPGHTLLEDETNAEHKVEIKFIKSGDSLLELMEPISESSVLNTFLSKRGEGLHHICYKVDSVAIELENLKAKGTRLIDQTPRNGSRGFKVAFIHPHASNSGVLIELCSEV